MGARLLLHQQGSGSEAMAACEAPGTLWGLPGGAVAALFLLLGVALGAGAGAGAMLLWQRRQRRITRKRPEGGWRISAALTSGQPSTIGQAPPSQLHPEDDSTFTNILKQAIQVLGRRSSLSPSKGVSPRATSDPRPSWAAVSIAEEGRREGARTHRDSLEDVVLQDTSAIHESLESGSMASLACPIEKLQASIGPREGLAKVPEGDGEPNSPVTPLNRVCETNRSEELSTSIDSHYDLDDLDDDWLMLLQQIDERLIDSGKPTMIPRERSIAIRSLLATADTEDRSSALDRAIGDVEMLRV
mmetsp:Transcript_17806/g.46337  ORF Transcript_17806/g.46337 Transcript_17806/m.46337 type:complete len:302 (+) Transcript_17806:417-1322(+)